MIALFSKLLFHVLMIFAVLVLWRILFRKSPSSVWAICIGSFFGPFLALFLAIGIGIIIRRACMGQLFAEGLFFEGSLFLFGCAFFLFRQKSNEKRRLGLSVFAFVLASLVLGVGSYSLLIEPYRLGITHYTLESEKLQKPLRIVFLADIQTDQLSRYDQYALRLANQIEGVDLYLFGGDYLQVQSSRGSRLLYTEMDKLNRALQTCPWNASLGAFAVDGNMDFDTNWPKIFAGTGIEASTESKTVYLEHGGDEIALSLLTFHDTRFAAENVTQFEEEPDYHIVLGHDPSYAGRAVNGDLLLAGHTHGGQVRIPWFGPILLVTRGIPRSWTYGKTELPNGNTLIVSNGVGMERGRAPRIRFLAPPEIVVIDILPKR